MTDELQLSYPILCLFNHQCQSHSQLPTQNLSLAACAEKKCIEVAKVSPTVATEISDGHHSHRVPKLCIICPNLCMNASIAVSV